MSYAYPSKMGAKEFEREEFRLWYTKIINECRVDNQKEYQSLVSRWNTALTAVASIWGTDSRQYKYIKREGIPHPPDLDLIEKNTFRAYDKWLKKQAVEPQVVSRNTKQKEPEKIHESMHEYTGPKVYDDPNTRNF